MTTTEEDPALYDELARQRLILLREMPQRLLLGSLGIALCALFAAPVIVMATWAVYLLAEAAGPWLQQPERIRQTRGGYGIALAQSVVVEGAYMAAAAVVWLDDDPFAKAFAVGLASTVLMHLATVRSIHLPIGLAGLAGATGVLFVANTSYWVGRGDPVGLAMSSAAAFGAIAYAMTAMLSNNRLHRSMAQKEAAARAANDAKSLFLAQMSHELRTPLNAIIGMAQADLDDRPATFSSGAGGQDTRKRMLLDNALALATILDDVTDLNDAANARLRLRLRPFDLCQEVHAITDAFMVRAVRLGVPFQLICKGDAPGMVRMDAVRLRQCIGNLLSNALRHAQGGAITATAWVEPGPSDGEGLLVMDVSDTGPGVPEDQREAIFAAFHRGRAAAPGTGLGLAIARRLARLMEGDLRLLPTTQGATFRLTARYHAADGATVDPHPPDLSGRRILVVDDIASNRLVAATYLRSFGAQVLEASDGEEALAILSTEDLDLLLLDMNMPRMDGCEIARRIRRMGGPLAALPILAMTADVMEDQVRAFRGAGADGHVAKPLLPDDLAAEIRRVL